MQLNLQRPRKQHVAGDADDDRVRRDAGEGGANRLRIVTDGGAIDRFAEEEKRANRKSCREPLAG